MATSKSRLAILKALYNLQAELANPFIIDSSIHGPVYIMFQTSFMKTIMQESIQSWSDNIEDSPAVGRRGFVTDGDHSFFREGVLNITCVFSPTMLSWIPVLYTWILRQDTGHHRPHFRSICQSVAEYIKLNNIPFEPKYLLHVCFAFILQVITNVSILV